MSSAAEAAGARTEFAAGLAAGVEAISQRQTITFTRYDRAVLPLDGYVFWVKHAPLDQIDVLGSLHYSTDNQRSEDEGFALNRVIFTSETEIEQLNDVNDGVLYIGAIDQIQFAFSRRSLYRQSGLFHYQGDALYPALASQLVDNKGALNVEQVIVSNSLPIWLTLNAFMPMYPSYLVPENITPPWCAVHIEETQALQAAPYLDSTSSHYQLCRDKVRLTVYGMRNNDILSFMDYVNSYSLNTDTFGIENMPTVRDGKRVQTELGIIAQQKFIEFEINYYQYASRALGKQLITTALMSFLFPTTIEDEIFWADTSGNQIIWADENNNQMFWLASAYLP